MSSLNGPAKKLKLTDRFIFPRVNGWERSVESDPLPPEHGRRLTEEFLGGRVSVLNPNTREPAAPAAAIPRLIRSRPVMVRDNSRDRQLQQVCRRG